ncbi:HigA family addiction module antitoxin [Rhodocyclus purpureus]|uniref:HigA family addiction module antitoxin n=1 Tax=Rhodocyclus purpureus TaxID=1067 RepID=UPI001913238B|nr:HigA family addiction module antitoxin [Rhodocyclus purpureus]MBK5914825.1 addiction module antidote protein, HigA family [Rhodocyclus purpureus]
MAQMFNPPHPGDTLREDILPEMGLSVSEAARQLGVSRVQLSRVLNGRAPISADLALRLEQWLPNPPADVWLRMQLAHDLWQARQSDKLPKVAPAHAQPAHT